MTVSTVAVAVIGGGVAGCAAAVAAAAAGARVTLFEAGGGLGGVAAAGEHRSLCGLAPLDSDAAELLEPGLTAAWVDALVSGAPWRQGRVWLWPTDPATLQAGLARRLAAAGAAVRSGVAVEGLRCAGGRVAALVAAGVEHPVDALIDASGRGIAATLLGRDLAAAAQWPAHRSVLRLPALGPGRGERLRALALAQRASGGAAALALVPLDASAATWQLSLDVPPGSSLGAAAAAAERIAAALGGELLACARAIAERDAGRPQAQLTCDELFASVDRGLCWAAWPREQHGPDGVAWTYPDGPRHGIPERAVRLVDGPANCWFVGKGMPVDAAAAAALRVTGTCLALGGSVGEAAVREVQAAAR